MPRLIVSLLLVGLLSTVALSGAIVVDGQLDDWGVTVADSNGSDMDTFTPASGIGFLGAFAEDTNDNSNGYWVGPNSGGQNYDGELIAAASDGLYVYLAVVSGQRPDNGLSSFGPGDIRIEGPDGTTFGIEVGGGQGGVTPAAAVLTEGMAGATYVLNGNGQTLSYLEHAAVQGDITQTAGSMWENPDWILDPINPYGPTQIQFIGQDDDYLGMVDYAFSLNSVTGQHSIMEMAIPIAWLGGTGDYSFHWRPSCGNDELDLDALVHAPEPGSVVLLMLGGLGLGGVLVRQRRRRDR